MKRPLLIKTSVIIWSLALATVAVICTVAITALGTKSSKTFNAVPQVALPSQSAERPPTAPAPLDDGP